MSSPTLLMIRPEKQAEVFVEALHRHLKRDVQVYFSPLIRIEPVPNAINLKNVSHLLFTSANAVEQFTCRSIERSLPALCIGDITAASATAAGLDTLSAEGTALDLVRLAGEQDRPSESRMLYLRGNEVSFDLKSSFEVLAMPISETVLYRQTPLPLSAQAKLLLSVQPVVVPIFSANGAKTFLQAVSQISLQNVTLVCMSKNISALFDGTPMATVQIASAASREEMIETLSELV